MAVRLDAAHTWPLQTVLPLVKQDDSLWPELGLLVAGRGPVVHLCALDQASPAYLAGCGTLAYPDFAAVTRAGWEVD